VIQVIADIDAPEPAEEKINAYLAAHAGEVDGIVTTAWVPGGRGVERAAPDRRQAHQDGGHRP
jgi:NAD/NADP transhydrogenase alpha subunit